MSNSAKASPVTESQDARFSHLDRMDTSELVTLMNQVDREVPVAIEEAREQITSAIEAISNNYLQGGRLIYIGAGTSGRIATLDASEVFPTFGVKDRVIAVMAGGRDALVNPSEGAEDDFEMGKKAVRELGLSEIDTLVGVASSGTTPYVLGAVMEAKANKATTVGIACNSGSELSKTVDYPIEAVVGPELIAGSTRLKAGTAQKMILNMISTITMIKAGKTYGNLMVDVVPSNQKLRKRAINIVSEITGVTAGEAESELISHQWNVKSAVVGIKLGLDHKSSVQLLSQSSDYLAIALGEIN